MPLVSYDVLLLTSFQTEAEKNWKRTCRASCIRCILPSKSRENYLGQGLLSSFWKECFLNSSFRRNLHLLHFCTAAVANIAEALGSFKPESLKDSDWDFLQLCKSSKPILSDYNMSTLRGTTFAEFLFHINAFFFAVAVPTTVLAFLWPLQKECNFSQSIFLWFISQCGDFEQYLFSLHLQPTQSGFPSGWKEVNFVLYFNHSNFSLLEEGGIWKAGAKSALGAALLTGKLSFVHSSVDEHHTACYYSLPYSTNAYVKNGPLSQGEIRRTLVSGATFFAVVQSVVFARLLFWMTTASDFWCSRKWVPSCVGPFLLVNVFPKVYKQHIDSSMYTKCWNCMELQRIQSLKRNSKGCVNQNYHYRDAKSIMIYSWERSK